MYSEWHKTTESTLGCTKCKSFAVSKVYSINRIVSETPIQNKDVGDATRELIEENLQLLKESKQEKLEWKKD